MCRKRVRSIGMVEERMSEDGLDGKPESSSSRLPGPTTKVAFGKADASPMLDQTGWSVLFVGT